MHSGQHQSSLLWSLSENAHVKDGHICDENQYLFQGKLLPIVSYSRTVSNYFESKSDIYSLLITVELIYLDKNV